MSMVGGAFERAVRRGPTPRPQSWDDSRLTAVVVSYGTVAGVDAGLAYCRPVGAVADVAVGPCRGANVPDTSSCPAGAHTHGYVPLPVGTVVLVERSNDGWWVTRAHLQ